MSKKVFESKQGNTWDAKHKGVRSTCIQERKEQNCNWEDVVRKAKPHVFCPCCMSPNIGFKGFRVKEVGDGS